MHTNDTTVSALMRASTEQIAALRHDANESHIAEHIRGMVSVTMGNLATDATHTLRADAERWQKWALDLADGLTLPVAGQPT